MSISDAIKEQIEKAEPAGLKGRSFGAVFRGDRTPERIEFEVGGNEAWVDLLAMNKNKRDELGDRFGSGPVADRIAGFNTFLVTNTCTDFLLWTKATDPETGTQEWIRVSPPPEKGRPKHWLDDFWKTGADLFPDFWDALLAECLRVNGIGEQAEGN